MWRELIVESRFGANDEDPVWCFRDPATEQELATVERALDCPLPGELAELLRETNGLALDWGDEPDANLIFSAREIIETNQSFRSRSDEAYMPFAHLLAFASVGNGDLFCFPIMASGEPGSAVFLWDHETDSRYRVFSSLEEFISQFNKAES